MFCKNCLYPLLFVAISILFIQCNKEAFTLSTQAEDFFFLVHKDATIPVQVEGNTASGKMIIFLHGGPGGSSILINELFTSFTEGLEKEFGVAYYDQRSSGTAQGSFSVDLMTPEQHVEDLERLVILLKNKYGQDIDLYLCGISWGGYLGNAFLSKGNNQELFKGWINLVGAHDFQQIAVLGRERLLFYAEQQMSLGNNQEDWESINDYCIEHPQVNDLEDFIQINGRAHRGGLLMKDSLQQQLEVAPLGAQLAFAFFSPYDVNAMLANGFNIRNSDLLEHIFANPLQAQLPKITLPSIIIGGHYDFVVPTDALQEQYDLYQSEDKAIHILPHSGHTIIGDEIDKLLGLVVPFVERL